MYWNTCRASFVVLVVDVVVDVVVVLVDVVVVVVLGDVVFVYFCRYLPQFKRTERDGEYLCAR